MKFLATFLPLLPAVLADFHINNMHSTVAISPTSQDSWDTTVACPSNYYKCACLVSDDRTGHITDGDVGDDFFAIEAGFCGMPKMNFYKSGDLYGFFVDGGDGTQLGTCYWNSEEQKQCGIAMGSSITSGGYVCYSYVCN